MAGGSNRAYLVIIALLIIVIIGFIAFAFMDGLLKFPSLSTSPQALLTPKQLLMKDLSLLNTTPAYEATYNVSVPSLSSVLGLLGVSNNTPLQALIFKSGNLTKVVTSIGTYTIAFYGIGKGNFVICEESGGFSYASTGITCSYQNDTNILSALGGSGLPTQQIDGQILVGEPDTINTIFGILNETNVTYLGNKEIAGSECNEFRLSAGQKEINSLMNLSENYTLSGSSYLNPASGSPFNGSLTGYLCLDEQNGLPLSLNLSENYYNQLLSENKTTDLLTITASNVGTDVPSSAFNVPVSFVISSNYGEPNCTSDSVSFSFVSFRNTANSTVRVSTSSIQYNFTYGTYTYNNQTASVNLGKNLVYGNIYKVNATFAKNITSAQSYGYSYIYPKICVDGYCSSSNSCLVYSSYNAQGSSSEAINSYPDFLIYDNANKYVYVADFYSDQVSILNGTNLVANINVSTFPDYLAYDAYSKYVYEVSSYGNITIINNTKVVGSINLDYYSSPTGIVYDPQDHLIYLADWGNDTIDIINGTNVIKTLYSGQSPDGIAYDPKNGLVYVSDGLSGEVTAIRNESIYGNVTSAGTYSLGNIGVDNATGYIYLVKEYGNSGIYGSYNYSLNVINGTQEIGTIALNSQEQPVAFSFDPGNGDMYFVVENSNSSNELLAVNGTSVINTITSNNNTGYGRTSESIAYDPGNGYLYVVNFYSNSVSVFNDTGLLDTVDVGINPVSIIYNPSNGYMYVANTNSGTVSVIDGTAVIATINV